MPRIDRSSIEDTSIDQFYIQHRLTGQVMHPMYTNFSELLVSDD